MGLSTEEEMCLVYYIYYPALPPGNDHCSSGNFTGLHSSHYNSSMAFCGSMSITDWEPTPAIPYTPPPCIYEAPDPARMTPTLREGGINLQDYERSQYLDDEKKYRLYWTVNKTGLILNAAVEVETTGWVGLGVSAFGMEGADVFIGWVKDGIVYFADRFATAKAQPPIDAKQDFYDVSGAEVVPQTEASSQTWIEGLSRAAIAGFFLAVGAVIVLILGGMYLFYKKKHAKTQYYDLGDADTEDSSPGKASMTLISRN